MNYISTKIEKKCEELENTILGKILLSHTVLAFFYGVFLFIYELEFFKECSHIVHPILIGWSVLIIIYDIVIRKILDKIPYWKILILFAISAGITAVLTINAGGVGNIKAWILTMLPLFVFYPVCLLQSDRNRLKTFLFVMAGAAVVSCLASGVAIWMYFIRLSGTVTFMGITGRVGIVHYLPSDPNSAILLYGLYTDTNHAALYSLFFILYGVLLLYFCYQEKDMNKWIKLMIRAFAVVNIIIQTCYFPLANSRGGFLSMCVSIFIAALFCFFSIFSKKNGSLKYIFSIGCAIVLMLISCFGFWSIRTGLSTLSVNYGEKRSESSEQNKKSQKQSNTVKAPNDGKKGNVEKSEVEKNDKKKESSKVEEDSFVKKNDNFGAGRLEIWEDTMILIKNRPFMGEGPGNKAYYAPLYSADGVIAQKGSDVHNSYLDLILDYGIIGGGILLSFLILCASKVLRCLLIEKRRFNICFYLYIASVLVTASCSFLISSAFINVTALYFIMLIAMGYLMAECSKN